ncbi:hypothetical protein DENSPDRAFT_778039 [Dentipellis sp. KUC8613]|nr:hypothetical protein DENSPDRAFT_778039 [Dentipellis sp. KUC8613]
MVFYCNSCHRPFSNASAFTRHRNLIHRNPLPAATASHFRYHPILTGRPCDRYGKYLAPGTPPEPLDDGHDWAPFDDRPSFHFAQLVFEKMQTSVGDVNTLLEILGARECLVHGKDGKPMFQNADHLLETIDAIDYGEVSWQSFSVRYNGPIDDTSASWKRETYVIHARNTLQVVRTMLSNTEFDGSFHTCPFEEYTGPHKQRYSDMMSGRWVWKKSIAHDCPNMDGTMLVPIILGADKTTVSVATGNTEFHPVYMSIGNVTNQERRAHGEVLIPIAFLSIPKAARQFTDDDDFRLFRKQLYHTSLAHIMMPLRDGMTEPVVLRCPDGHWRRAVFEIGPFIADYPEQVYLAGIVQNWCPKCRACPEDLELLDLDSGPRFRRHTEVLLNTYDAADLWEAFGIATDVLPFTFHFPCADIYELLSPDLLHQVIKGTFKDHLVTWVEEYLHVKHGKAEGDRIMDDIDRRIAAVPAFPGLRRFPEGCNFKQWTGDDSKALMKVYLPAICGHVPVRMVRCLKAFLDFCYLARRSSHDEAALTSMQDALSQFQRDREVFREEGSRADGFSLPRQHSLRHYVPGIRLFASPNGLCSSITESKHIKAVKEPWCRSSRNKPLAQIIKTNTRLAKLAAARTEFGRRGMLDGSFVMAAQREAGLDWVEEDTDDVRAYSQKLQELALEVGDTALELHFRRFLYDQLYGDDNHSSQDILDSDLPVIGSTVRIYKSAVATFYAPSELSGRGGMHSERIRSTAMWYGEGEQRDTVLVQNGETTDPMGGMLVARIQRFVSFMHQDAIYPCAIVNWYMPDGNAPDPDTGMWVVLPEKSNDKRTIGVVHMDCLVRACHLIPVYGQTRLPVGFRRTDSHIAFKGYYVNHYIDYHTHECILR